jgi:hypothetical protein
MNRWLGHLGIAIGHVDRARRLDPSQASSGDALSLTFAYPVAKRDWCEERRFQQGL